MEIVTGNLPPIHDLPAGMAREIGRIAVAFSRLEWTILQIMYSVVGISPPMGRLVIKDQDAAGQFKLICRLLKMNAIKHNVDTQPLCDAIASCQAQRNDVIHSIWVKEPKTGRLMMCMFRGEWSQEIGMKDKSHRTNPEGRLYTLEEAKSLTHLIEGTVDNLLDFNLQVRERHSSPQKSQSPF